LVRQRVLAGEAIPPKLIRRFGALGLLGCAVGVALSLKVVDWITWGEPAGEQVKLTAAMGLIALFTASAGAALVWSALRQSQWEIFATGREQELAEALIEAERAEAEADADSERKKMSGAAGVVFFAGLGGGILLMSRLPDAEGGCAFVSSVLAMMCSGCSVYMARRRVARWRLWVPLLTLGVAGLIVYFVRQFEVKPWWAVVGMAWGAPFGVAMATLYVRRLERLEGAAGKGIGARTDAGHKGKLPPGGITKM
jgi:hypothetical protein